jgi:hypothetical protein
MTWTIVIKLNTKNALFYLKNLVIYILSQFSKQGPDHRFRLHRWELALWRGGTICLI